MYSAEIISDPIMELMETAKARGRGRPKNLSNRNHIKKCRKFGCSNSPAIGQAYCCRDHAPYGNFEREKHGKKQPRSIYKKKDEPKVKRKVLKGDRWTSQPAICHGALEPAPPMRGDSTIFDQPEHNREEAIQLDFWILWGIDS